MYINFGKNKFVLTFNFFAVIRIIQFFPSTIFSSLLFYLKELAVVDVFIMCELVFPLHTLCVYLRLVCNLVRLRSVVLWPVSLYLLVYVRILYSVNLSHVFCFLITLRLAHHLTSSPLFVICNNTL